MTLLSNINNLKSCTTSFKNLKNFLNFCDVFYSTSKICREIAHNFFWFFQYLLKCSRNYIFQNLSVFSQYSFKVSPYFFRVFMYWEVSILIDNHPRSTDTYRYFIVSILPITNKWRLLALQNLKLQIMKKYMPWFLKTRRQVLKMSKDLYAFASSSFFKEEVMKRNFILKASTQND